MLDDARVLVVGLLDEKGIVLNLTGGVLLRPGGGGGEEQSRGEEPTRSGQQGPNDRRIPEWENLLPSGRSGAPAVRTVEKEDPDDLDQDHPVAEADEKLRKALEKQRELYPIEYAESVPAPRSGANEMSGIVARTA